MTNLDGREALGGLGFLLVSELPPLCGAAVSSYCVHGMSNLDGPEALRGLGFTPLSEEPPPHLYHRFLSHQLS